MNKGNTQYKQILIDLNNYNALKQLGQTGESFNEVIHELIDNHKEKESKRKDCL
jgi:predicted CopG family antitoxin